MRLLTEAQAARRIPIDRALLRVAKWLGLIEAQCVRPYLYDAREVDRFARRWGYQRVLHVAGEMIVLVNDIGPPYYPYLEPYTDEDLDD